MFSVIDLVLILLSSDSEIVALILSVVQSFVPSKNSYNILAMRISLYRISPPLAFLQSLGGPTVPFKI